MRKFVKSKKTVLIVAIVTVFLLLISAVSLFGCSSDVSETKNIDLAFDVVKINSRGEEIDTLRIHLTGQYFDYREQGDAIELDIEDFDTFTNIRMREENNFVYFEEQQRGCVYFETERSDRIYTETLRLYFSENFDRVILEGRGETLYIGSGSGKYTAQECISYFEEDGETWDFVESVNIDMTVDAVRVDKSGREIETLQLDISGYYRNYLFGAGNIYLNIEPSKKNIGSMKTGNSTELSWCEHENKNAAVASIYLGGYDVNKDRMYSLWLTTTDELDRFVIWSKEEGVFFVGSVGGKYTAQEIVAYFNDFTNTGITLPEEQ